MNTTPPTPPGVKEQSLLVKALGNSPKIRILDYFLDFPTNDFTKKEIIEALGMSKQTFYKYFDDLEVVGFLKVNRTIGKAKLYQLDSGNEMTKTLRDMEEKMSMKIAEEEAMEETIPAE